jgi:hypothetical protein
MKPLQMTTHPRDAHGAILGFVLAYLMEASGNRAANEGGLWLSPNVLQWMPGGATRLIRLCGYPALEIRSSAGITMEQRHRFTALIFSVVGACIGLGLMGLQLWMAVTLPPSSLVKRTVLALNWPPIAFLEWYAKAFKNGNSDQMLGPWLLIFPLYWIIIGSAVGLGCYFLMPRRKRS